MIIVVFLLFFFNDTATTEIYTLSLHDALPIYLLPALAQEELDEGARGLRIAGAGEDRHGLRRDEGVLRSEEHTSELQSRLHLVCRLLLEKKKNRVTSLVQHSLLDIQTATIDSR